MHSSDRGAIFSVMAKHPKRPRDPNQLAHMIVGIVTGKAEEASPVDAGKYPAAVELGRLGGRKGGKARAAALTPEERRAAAQKAAAARWSIKRAFSDPS
jgi:hypothetical protein